MRAWRVRASDLPSGQAAGVGRAGVQGRKPSRIRARGGMGKVQGPSQAGLQVSGARTQGKGGGPGPLGMSPQGVRPLGPPGSNSRHASSPRQGHDCLSQAWLHSGEAGDHGRLGQVHLEQAVQGPQACIPTVLEARVWAASGPGLSRRAGRRNLGAVLVAGAARGGSDGDRMRAAMQALKLAGTPHPALRGCTPTPRR